MQDAEYCRIPLHDCHGDVVAHALVDLEDAHLAEHRWSPHVAGYAIRFVWIAGVGQRSILLHRVILDLKHGDGLQSDHVNGDRLDNRRANLRVVTHAQNGQNVAPRRGCTSAFRGVSWDKVNEKWRAYARIDGRMHTLGRFAEEATAADVAARFRAEHMSHATDREMSR